MRILFLHQHYYPETVGTSTRAVEIAEWLAARGHLVTVICGIPSHPSTMASGEVPRRQPQFEVRNGVEVHRVWTYGTRRRDTFLRRVLAYGSFMIIGALKALFIPGRYDALVAVSPLPDGVAGMVVSKLRGLPLMFDVCDIWPDCAVAVGMLKSRILIWFSHWIEKRVYARSVRIGVVTRGFTENLHAKGVPREKIRLLPDWVEPDVYDSSQVDATAVRAEYGLEGRFVVSFFGNFGLIMGLEAILEAARIVKDSDPGVLFLFVGKGVGLPMMEERIGEWGLSNVRVLPYQPRDKVPGLLAASDVLIVTYKKTELTLITVPSKIYEYLSSARPIVAGVDGVVADILTESGASLVSRSCEPGELAEMIRTLKSDADLCAQMGRSGRVYASANFAFEKVAADYEVALIETVTGVS